VRTPQSKTGASGVTISEPPPKIGPAVIVAAVEPELGQRIGLTRQTIAAIEAGKYSPTLEAAFRIAQVFNVPLSEVFRWDTKPIP